MTRSEARANPLAGNPLRTRSDLQRAVIDLVDPLLPHFSEGCARVRLGSFGAVFPTADAELEGFARPLWGLAPLSAGGGRFDHWDVWRRGLASGSDPASSECWHLYEGTAQTMVEQSAIGLALALAPEELWEPLSSEQRDHLVAWLSRINRYDLVPNNWQFFRILTNLGLERVGAPIDVEAMKRSFDLIESYYLGDGWYRDGFSGARDHYIGWAFHTYGLIYARLRPDDERSAVFRARAREFARDFEVWFDPAGGVVPFGRSLTYRFAAAGFWAALAFAEEEALPWGRVKGLLLRHLRWWSTRPISDRDGVLSLGWTYTNPWMREEYNSACSPYWAMKAFLCLALPEGHAFWQAEEEPVEPRPCVVQPRAGMLLSRDRSQVIALNGGHGTVGWIDQGAAKYGRLAYSSVFGFSADGPLRGGRRERDSTLTLARSGEVADGTRTVQECAPEGDLLYCRWSPFEGVVVHTLLWARAPWHVRVHRVVTGAALETEESGFALGLSDPGLFSGSEGAGAARVESERGVSALQALLGNRDGVVRRLASNANLVSPHAAVPLLRADLEPGTHDLACAVYATDRPESDAEISPPEIPERVWQVLDQRAPRS